MGVGWGGGGNLGIVKNCQASDKSKYTHVCRLCWPCGGEGEDSAGDLPSPLGRWGGASGRVQLDHHVLRPPILRSWYLSGTGPDSSCASLLPVGLQLRDRLQDYRRRLVHLDDACPPSLRELIGRMAIFQPILKGASHLALVQGVVAIFLSGRRRKF